MFKAVVYGLICSSAAALFAAQTGSQVPVHFFDDFSVYSKDQCFKEGSTFGSWSVLFTGFGCARVETGSGETWLRVDTAKSQRAHETHALFVAGPSFSVPLSLEARVTTLKQLRRKQAPNPWEVGWLVWNYQDNNHFYYFVPRTNGWEIGKRDPSYPAGQRALASGSSPSFPLGVWKTVRIEQDADNSIGVFAEGHRLAFFKDQERPYTSGRIGFYDEDSRACIADISVSARPVAP